MLSPWSFSLPCPRLHIEQRLSRTTYLASRIKQFRDMCWLVTVSKVAWTEYSAPPLVF